MHDALPVLRTHAPEAFAPHHGDHVRNQMQLSFGQEQQGSFNPRLLGDVPECDHRHSMPAATYLKLS